MQSIKLSGLTCPACKKLSEKRIGGIRGVKKVDVSLDSGNVSISADREIPLSEIRKVLEDTSYTVSEK